MAFKINIGTKDGKTYKIETDSQALVGKSLNEKVKGEDVSPDLSGYEFEIKGASDKAGFTAMENVEGIGLKKVLLKYGKGMHKRPRSEAKFKHATMKPKGLRLRKTVRGKVISDSIVQINLKLLKEGSKKLSEIFPDQNAKPEENKTEEAPAQEEKPSEEKKEEEKKE